MISFWKILIALLVLLVLFEVGQFLLSFRKAKKLSEQAESFSHTPEESELKFLVAGDSTAEGVGAEEPINTVAGRFHQDFPQAKIVNLGQEGYKIKDVKQSLKQVEGEFDLVILHAGANDILYFTSFEEAKRNMRSLLNEAKSLSDNVVLITSGNIGLSPILPFPVGWYYSKRSKKYLNAFEDIAQEEDVAFVDIYNSEKNDLFEEEPDKYYAHDRIHLSDQGYGLWYEEIRGTMEEANIKLKEQ